MLCCVKVDISDIPYTSKLGEAGKKGYTRKYNLILLVGLTELKAQISWTDPKTVREYLVQSIRTRSSHPTSTCANLGGREKVCSNVFRVCPP